MLAAPVAKPIRGNPADRLRFGIATNKEKPAGDGGRVWLTRELRQRKVLAGGIFRIGRASPQ